jgi:putative hemolysin
MMISDRPTKVFAARISSKRVPRPLVTLARLCVDRLLGFEQFNAVYRKLPPAKVTDFSDLFLDALQTKTLFDGEPSESIPAEGPLAIVANHPTGPIDAMLLERLLLPVRPDLAILIAEVFSEIPDARARHIVVIPKLVRRGRQRSVRGWMDVIKRLEAGRAVAMFPAGLVSTFRWRQGRFADRDWSPHIAAVIRRSRAPVLPVYIHARCSKAQRLLGVLSPLLQNLRAVGAVSAYRGKTLRVTVGRLIEPAELAAFNSHEAAIAFLRQRTEELAGQAPRS